MKARSYTSWLIYEITGHDWMLGVVSFVGQIPILLLAPMAGVWVEETNRRRMHDLPRQALAMFQSLCQRRWRSPA